MSMQANPVGFEAWDAAMGARARRLPELLRAALAAELQPVFDESQELVPVLTQVLKTTGYVETAVSGAIAAGRIGYGPGGAESYATLQHENLGFAHPRGGQAKFVEEPLLKRIDDIPGNVVRRVVADL